MNDKDYKDIRTGKGNKKPEVVKGLKIALIAITMLTAVGSASAQEISYDYSLNDVNGYAIHTAQGLVTVSTNDNGAYVYHAKNGSVVTESPVSNDAITYQTDKGFVYMNAYSGVRMSTDRQIGDADDFLKNDWASDGTNALNEYKGDSYGLFTYDGDAYFINNTVFNKVGNVDNAYRVEFGDIAPKAQQLAVYATGTCKLTIKNFDGSNLLKRSDICLVQSTAWSSDSLDWGGGSWWTITQHGNLLEINDDTGNIVGNNTVGISGESYWSGIEYVNGMIYYGNSSDTMNTYNTSSESIVDTTSIRSGELGRTVIENTANRLFVSNEQHTETEAYLLPNEKPTVSELGVKPSNLSYGDSLDVNATATDDSGITGLNVTAYFNGQIQKTQQFSTASVSLDDWITTNAYGDWNISVTATDTVGQTDMDSTLVSVTNFNPNITSIYTEPSNPDERDDITLKTDVVDDKRVDYVEIRALDDTNWINATKTGAFTWKVEDIITDAEYKNYTFEAIAYDEYGLTDSNSFSVQTNFVNDPPVILSAYTYPNKIEIDDSIDLYVDAEDPDTQIDNVTARIYYKGDTLVKSSSLKYDRKSDLYEAENAFTVLQNGTYDVEYTATDTGGLKDTTTSEFTVGPEENDTVIIGDSTDSDKPKGFLGTLIDSIWRADSTMFMLLLMIGLIAYALLFEE